MLCMRIVSRSFPPCVVLSVVIGLFAALTMASPAPAQAPPPPPAGAAPGKATEPNVRFREPIKDHQSPKAGAGPATQALPNVFSEGIEIPSPDGQFVLNAVDFDGMTVYNADDLAGTYTSFVGNRVGLAGLQQIAEAVQKRYRADGYFLARVQVPSQRITTGTPRLRIDEGFISQVDVDGDAIPGKQKAVDYLEQVTLQRPLKFETLERALLLANDLPGLTVSVVLRQTNDPSGSIILLARITRKTGSGFVSVDNFGSVFTGRLQGAGGLSSQARTEYGEQVQVIFLGAGPFEPADAYVGQVSGSAAIGNQGLRLKGTLSVGRSNAGAFLSGANLQSDSILGIAEILYPYIRKRNLSVDLIAAAEFVNTDTTGFGTPPGGLDDVSRVVALRGLVTWADDKRGLNRFDVALRTALPFLGSTDRDDLSTRPGAGGAYLVVVGEASRVQEVTDKIFVVANVAAQISSNNVLASEEFTAGGNRYGRGFNEAQVAGDRGMGASLEVQFRNAAQSLSWLDAYQAFAFLDYGIARNQFTQQSQTITSAGFGMRTVVKENTLGEVLVAVPFGGRGTIRDGSDAAGDYDPQILFRLSNTF